ncbi:MAG: hypothetical protein GKC06_04430 [Methanomicrobiales archaeon]|nr:hypothetical protein [Methanomicrobiales archaeon]
MNREHVLTVILVLSLCANVYLAFTDHSSLNPDVQEFVSIVVPGAYNPNISPGSSGINNSNPDNPDQEPDNETDHGSRADGEEIPNIEDPDEQLTIPVPSPTPETVEPTPTPDGWTTYTSKKYAFSVRYPITWDLNDGSTGSPGRMLVLTAPTESDCDQINAQCFKYIASMTFEIDQHPDTLVLEDYFNSAVAALQEDYGITATSKSASCMLSGNRAYQIEFYTRDERGNPDRSYMQYYVLIDKKGYIISYTGPFSNVEHVFAINKGDAQRIIDSFWVERTFEVV